MSFVVQRRVQLVGEESWLKVAGPCPTRPEAERELHFQNRCGGKRGLGVAKDDLRIVETGET